MDKKKTKLKKLIKNIKKYVRPKGYHAQKTKYWICSKCKSIELQRPLGVVCKACNEGYMEKREKL